SWEVRGGALHGRQVNTTYSGLTFPLARAGLSGAELPRTVEVRFAYRADRPLVMGVTLGEPNGRRAYSALLCGGPQPFRAPCARLQQVTDGPKVSYVGVERPFRAEPGRWQRVRLLREPERIRVYVDDVESFSERIPDVELPHLALQGSYGAVGDEIEFKDVEV